MDVVPLNESNPYFLMYRLFLCVYYLEYTVLDYYKLYFIASSLYI